MTKQEIRRFVCSTIHCSRGALPLARKITGRSLMYNDRQIENIIMSYLEANDFDDDIICEIVAIHPDKPFFDVYYQCEKEREQEEKELLEATAKKRIKSSKGLINANGTSNITATDSKKYTYPKVAMLLASGAVLGALIYSAVKN